MVDVSLIGGIPDPRRPDAAARSEADRRGRRPEGAGGAEAADGVAISPEARRAAEALQFAEFARAQPDIRPDRVEAAQQRVADGELEAPAVLRRAVERILENLV